MGVDVPALLRIPSWADSATVTGNLPKRLHVEGSAPAGSASTSMSILRPKSGSKRFNGAVSIKFCILPISANYTVYAHHFGTKDMSSDYYLEPPRRAYAIDVDPES